MTEASEQELRLEALRLAVAEREPMTTTVDRAEAYLAFLRGGRPGKAR